MTDTPPETVDQTPIDEVPLPESRLVRVRIGEIETDVTAAYAEVHELEVLDAPTGEGPTRNGRPLKPLTTVADQAADKKAATDTGAGQDA